MALLSYSRIAAVITRQSVRRKVVLDQTRIEYALAIVEPYTVLGPARANTVGRVYALTFCLIFHQRSRAT